MTAKASVSFGEFTLELEGTEAFVSTQLDAWASKITPGNARLLSAVNLTDQLDAAPSVEVVTNGKDGGPEKKVRRPASKQGGPSCASRIRDLIAEGFFTATRKVPEIADRLREKATPYEAKHISAALIHTVQAGRLRRVKAEGVWSYVNP